MAAEVRRLLLQVLFTLLPALFPLSFRFTLSAGLRSIDFGIVQATVEASGKRHVAGSTILKQKRLFTGRSYLETHLTMLLSSYNDPFDLIRVAEDLAERCRAAVSSAPVSFVDKSQGQESDRKQQSEDRPANKKNRLKKVSKKKVSILWCCW